MIHHGLELDVRSYSSLIGAAALAGDLPAAEGFFELMTGAPRPMGQKDDIRLNKSILNHTVMCFHQVSFKC